MTTLDGRLDDPAAFVSGVDDEQYAAIDRRYEAFDTILIGTNTYAEMHAYWPGALADDTGFVDSNAVINQRMAKKMNDYRKLVFTRNPSPPEREWQNSENVVAPEDDALVRVVADLKSQPGEDIHLAGGAALASDFVRLGLVDELPLHGVSRAVARRSVVRHGQGRESRAGQLGRFRQRCRRAPLPSELARPSATLEPPFT